MRYLSPCAENRIVFYGPAFPVHTRPCDNSDVRDNAKPPSMTGAFEVRLSKIAVCERFNKQASQQAALAQKKWLPGWRGLLTDSKKTHTHTRARTVNGAA